MHPLPHRGSLTDEDQGVILSLYEDPALVAEMRFQEAMEEAEMNMMKHEFVPAGFEALIGGLVAMNAKPMPKKRVTLLSEARKQLGEGLLPEPFEIASVANSSYNTHLSKLYGFAKAGFRTALVDYPISGTNTYARAVRGYRDLLVEYLDKAASANSGASIETPHAHEAVKAKKQKAAKITASKTKVAAPATKAKAPSKAAPARKAPAKKK